MSTVPTGEVHEDFRTLKEEVERETQEVEKLSPRGRSSLLCSLSKLLGKKKELQDLELTVRPRWKGGGCRQKAFGRRACGWRSRCGAGRSGRSGQWPGSPRVVKCLPHPTRRLPGATAPCAPLEKGKPVQIPPKHMLPLDEQKAGRGPAGPSLEGGSTSPFSTPRHSNQGTQESNPFQDLIAWKRNEEMEFPSWLSRNKPN